MVQWPHRRPLGDRPCAQWGLEKGLCHIQSYTWQSQSPLERMLMILMVGFLIPDFLIQPGPLLFGVGQQFRGSLGLVPLSYCPLVLTTPRAHRCGLTGTWALLKALCVKGFLYVGSPGP